jgi:transmembrane sensor
LKPDSKHIDTLITRYLANEASREDIRQLEAWMDASEANKKYFEGIRFAHDKAVASRPVIAFDADKAWNRMHEKMHNKVVQPKPEIKRIAVYQQTWFRVAASFTLFVGLSWSVFWSFNKIKESQVITVAAVEQVTNTTLADQSKVVLNRKSKIACSKGFGKTNREVSLEGEAFFDIRHDTILPFVVKTDETFIKDVGTSFNIKSYPDSTLIKVYVKSGIVHFYSADNPGISLLPGEVGIYDKVTSTFHKVETLETQTISYINRVFVFNKTHLADALEQLNKMYGEQIQLNDPMLSNMEITVTFENESLENIAGIIAETLGLKVVKQNNGWLISKY